MFKYPQYIGTHILRSMPFSICEAIKTQSAKNRASAGGVPRGVRTHDPLPGKQPLSTSAARQSLLESPAPGRQSVADLIGWCPWNSRSLDRRDAPRLQAGWRYCGEVIPDRYGNARNSPNLSGSKSARHIPRPGGPSDALRPVEQDKGKRQQNQ